MKADRITRRRFLETLPAVVGPCVLAASVRGAEDAPPPSEQIAVGLLGCGTRGAYVARGLGPRGARVVAVCDCHRQRRDRLAQLYGCRAYADFRDVLARSDIDAVVVATPEHWHAVMVIEACRQGKDIFCEKPLSHTIAEARAMVAAVHRYQRVLQVGTQQRSDAHYRLACELVRNGRIGEVSEVQVDPGFASRPCDLPGRPSPAELDWDLWLGPAPWAPYHPERCEKRFAWWQWEDYSGGQTTDHGAHDFDIVQWGLGMDGSGPVEIVPPHGNAQSPLTLRYASGVVVHSGRQGWQQRWSLVAFKGTKGTVSVWRGGIETRPTQLAATQSYSSA